MGKVDTKAVPTTVKLQEGYEAQRDNLLRILQERMGHQDVAGVRWAQEALASLERQHRDNVKMGTFRDHLEAFRRSQPGGWG